MAKIGILVPTKQIKERVIQNRDYYFDGKNYYGFNYIISEIDKKEHSVKYISSLESELNSVDFVLFSITSYYDIINLINELKNKNYKSKIIIGGAGLLNFSLLSKYVDIAVLGRAEGRINDIIAGKEFCNVWRKKTDRDIENIYNIGKPEFLIKTDHWNEVGAGCPHRCYFCQYSWKNNFKSKDGSYQNWDSGTQEDTIKNINWENYKPPHITSAIDGFTERSRMICNKKISNNLIREKFNKIYESLTSKGIRVNLYSITGLPFEKPEEKNFMEFFDIIKSIDRESDKRCIILMTATHFCPMPLTPMENEGVNFLNFRNHLIKNNNKYRYDGKTFSVYAQGQRCTSPISAIEECILYRSGINDIKIIEKIFLSSKYKSLRTFEKMKVIKKHFPERLWGYNDSDKIIPYIEYPKGFNSAKNKYYKNKEKYSNTE